MLRFQPDGLPTAPSANAAPLRPGHVVLAIGNHEGAPVASLDQCARGSNAAAPRRECQPAWTHLSITVKGRKIDGEYSREGHLVRVKHDNREKGAALGNSAVETLARDLLREMAEEGNA